MRDFDGAAFQQFELHGWSRKAGGYHRFYAPLTTPGVGSLLDAAAVDSDARVVDVGCGPGYVGAAAAARGARVVGVDQALPMVQLAARLTPSVHHLVADAQRLPLRSGSVSAVVASFVLHHLPDQQAALADWARVLADGGRVALTVWNHPDRCRFLGVFNDAVAAAGAATPTAVPAGPPMVTSDDAYEGLLTRAGLSRVTVTSTDWEHDFGSPDALWDGLLESSVRTAALITEQPDDVRASIRRQFEEIVRPYGGDGSLRVPVSVLQITGTKPGA